MSDLSNIRFESVAEEAWDAMVIGAGPAGGLAAFRLASEGARVLLVERKPFPRYKVCGACVNYRAIQTLELAGLPDLVGALPTRPLHRLRMYQGELRSDLRLQGSVAISRSVLDLELVRRAKEAGACFLDETSATVELQSKHEGFRYVRLQTDQNMTPQTVETKLVLAADGLAGSSLRECKLATKIHDDSRVGFGGSVQETRGRYQPFTIHMAIHPRGYVGLVQVENGQLNIAGAADADFLRESGGPVKCTRAIIDSTGLPAIEDASVSQKAPCNVVTTWTGTPALTRRRLHASAHRMLLLGDATGYVEPFTGEGIAWALTSACQAAPLALEGIENWNASIESRWQNIRDQHATRHQLTCRAVARMLRSPTIVRMSMQAVSTFPALAQPFLSRISAPAI